MFLSHNGQLIPCLCADPNWTKHMVKDGECKRCGQQFFDFAVTQ